MDRMKIMDPMETMDHQVVCVIKFLFDFAFDFIPIKDSMALRRTSIVHHIVVVVITEEVVMLQVVISPNKTVSMVFEVFEVFVVDVVEVVVVVLDDEVDQRMKSLFNNKYKIVLSIYF
jgi:hypothetical protein